MPVYIHVYTITLDCGSRGRGCAGVGGGVIGRVSAIERSHALVGGKP